MSKIPEDVVSAARGVASDVMHAAANCGVDAVANDIADAILAERERGKIKIAQAYQALLNMPTASDSEVARLLDYLLGDEVDEDFLPWPRQAINEETI